MRLSVPILFIVVAWFEKYLYPAKLKDTIEYRKHCIIFSINFYCTALKHNYTRRLSNNGPSIESLSPVLLLLLLHLFVIPSLLRHNRLSALTLGRQSGSHSRNRTVATSLCIIACRNSLVVKICWVTISDLPFQHNSSQNDDASLMGFIMGGSRCRRWNIDISRSFLKSFRLCSGGWDVMHSLGATISDWWYSTISLRGGIYRRRGDREGYSWFFLQMMNKCLFTQRNIF